RTRPRPCLSFAGRLGSRRKSPIGRDARGAGYAAARAARVVCARSAGAQPDGAAAWAACRGTRANCPALAQRNGRNRARDDCYTRAALKAPISLERGLALYRTMTRIRAFENAAEEASKGGVAAFGASLSEAKVRGPLHLSTGQEAVAAGVCIHLARTDLMTSTHRGHGHTIAKGASIAAMMGELFGRASGFNGGKGGSMHIADFSVGMLGANGVVAAGIPIAVGAAHALKVRGESAIVACFFGDGAINRGPFLEGLNWAAIHGLRILFVCEDNRWSATTATDAMTAGEGALARAQAIGVPGEQVDGNDVFAVA